MRRREIITLLGGAAGRRVNVAWLERDPCRIATPAAVAKPPGESARACLPAPLIEHGDAVDLDVDTGTVR